MSHSFIRGSSAAAAAGERNRRRQFPSPSSWLPVLQLALAGVLLLLRRRSGGGTAVVSALAAGAPPSKEPLSALLRQHAGTIAALRAAATAAEAPLTNDVSYLRFCLVDDSNDSDTPLEALHRALEWRTSEPGRRIRAAALRAVNEAMTSPDSGHRGWRNDAVLRAAPRADAISQYITGANCITTTSANGNADLVYCIRAGSIDDTGLMKAVPVADLVEFFLYVKEVNGIVCDLRSLSSSGCSAGEGDGDGDGDRLYSTITCNDLAGVKLVGGSADFRRALSESSRIATSVYPASYTGPTLLLNLPPLLNALVKLFTPLFPDSVRARLKFSQGLLRDVADLRTIASRSGSSPERAAFVRDLDALLRSK
jgi:hypothetical protein